MDTSIKTLNRNVQNPKKCKNIQKQTSKATIKMLCKLNKTDFVVR